MVSVTERARLELKRLLEASADMPQSRLRLMDRGEGNLGLGIDIEFPGDELVRYDGSTVLVVEHGLARSLRGITLDVDDTATGPEIVVCYASDNMVNARN